MQKIQIQTELDMNTILQQLKISELEAFAREISMHITQRKAKDKKTREAELLQKLNEECVLPHQHLQLFYFLIEKRRNKQLSKNEAKQLAQLIQEEEMMRLKRIKILGELAQLKNIPISQLTEQLGIKPPQSV